MSRATRYLIEQGHRRIAHLNGSRSGLVAAARLTPFSDAATGRGSSVPTAP